MVYPDPLKPAHGLSQLRRNHHLGQFDQQVALAVDRITQRVLQRIEDVVGIHVEVAAKTQPDQVPELVAQLFQPLLIHGPLVWIGVACMRGANDVGHALVGRFASHGKRSSHVRRSVIDAVNQVMMNVDHVPLLWVIYK